MGDLFSNAAFVTFLVILLIILVIAVAVLCLVRYVKRKFRQVAGMELSRFAKVISEGLEEESNIPKGINDLSAVYAPKINRDFPEIGYNSMAILVKNTLTAYLGAIETQSTSKMDKNQCSASLLAKANNLIYDLQSKGESEKYENIDIHKCGIASYNNKVEEASAAFEVSVGYVFSHTKDNNVETFSTDKNTDKKKDAKKKNNKKNKKTEIVRQKTEASYKVVLTYNQNRHEEASESVYTSTCPNCGAPVDMRTGKCGYCSASFTIIADRFWQVSDISRLK
ncbi:MAG: hypothetical protein J1E39_00215 [Eubacterium sp.]|nr:hypothetical protein [Eubacterium sp.]